MANMQFQQDYRIPVDPQIIQGLHSPWTDDAEGGSQGMDVDGAEGEDVDGEMGARLREELQEFAAEARLKEGER
jgi:hypothetical protein